MNSFITKLLLPILALFIFFSFSFPASAQNNSEPNISSQNDCPVKADSLKKDSSDQPDQQDGGKKIEPSIPKYYWPYDKKRERLERKELTKNMPFV